MTKGMKKEDILRVIASTFFFGLAFFIFSDLSFATIISNTAIYFIGDLFFTYFFLRKTE